MPRTSTGIGNGRRLDVIGGTSIEPTDSAEALPAAGSPNVGTKLTGQGTVHLIHRRGVATLGL